MYPNNLPVNRKPRRATFRPGVDTERGLAYHRCESHRTTVLSNGGKMTEFKTGSVQANGLNFHYLEMGEGPLALCLHGFPDHAYSFRHLLPDLAAAGFRAVAPFMRGYAPTEAPADGNYRSVTMAHDAVALVDALGGGQAYLIGNDWGAGAVIGAPCWPRRRCTSW